MLVALLGIPSAATCQSLLLLAYHEFGLNSEGSLWMYSGMAMRMAQDLGLHLVSCLETSGGTQADSSSDYAGHPATTCGCANEVG